MPPFRALHVIHVIGSQESGTAGPQSLKPTRKVFAYEQKQKKGKTHSYLFNCTFSVVMFSSHLVLGGSIPAILEPKSHQSFWRNKGNPPKQREDGKYLPQVKHAQTTSYR